MWRKIIYFIFVFSNLLLANNSEKILLNQIGFYRYGHKIAIVVSPKTWYFTIKSPDLKTIYYKGELSPIQYWDASGDSVKIADFTPLDICGDFVVYVEGIGASFPFSIKENNLLYDIEKGILKAFYYQRASTPLPTKYAGQWSRKAGHADLSVIIHESAILNSVGRKAGEVYPSPKGWYDAGDYGKYVVNAGITVYQLLLLYDLFPEYFARMQLNIPETTDEIPDILNEIKWEIDWLLTMQDPYDGGIYHKVTSKNFCGNIMPEADNDPRYFIGKSSAATFDFAAVCAMAYRIYKNFLPSFADSCLESALYAWEWGIKNPNLQFRNPEDVVTGEYGDSRLRDEQAWAAYELFIATGDSNFYNAGKKITLYSTIPSWQDVGMLGLFSMAILKDDSVSKNIIISKADKIIEEIKTHPYRIPITTQFYWGSNSVVANQGTILLVAFVLSKDVKYLEGAIHSCDYLLGRNGVGYCFVTGYGERSPLDPHHRPSIADKISPPLPGFLAGGPNDMNTRDGEACSKEYSPFPAKAWIDDKCSFTSNEVAINWNSAAAFLAGGIDAIFSLNKFDISELIKKKDSNKNYANFISIKFPFIKSDRAILQWKTEGNASVSVIICEDKNFECSTKIYAGEGDSGEILLKGLIPSTSYYVKCYSIDRNNHIAENIDSFYTSNTLLDLSSVVNHTIEMKDNEAIINFKSSDNFNAYLVYKRVGKSSEDTIAFAKKGENFTTLIPDSEISVEGIIYKIFLINKDDTIETRNFSFYLDSIVLIRKQFSSPETYQLIGIPGNFVSLPSVDFFKPFSGDTSLWRYYGYRVKENKYILFDSLACGKGGWLYHKNGFDIEITTKGINPDTLYPLILEEGWNCISNPFPFPVFWDNTLIEYKNTLIKISDSAAINSVRRQYFSYSDKTSDGINNGNYLSNRELVSHTYNDSAKLLPWEAYWIYAEKDSVSILLNPSPDLLKNKLVKRKTRNIKSWFVTLKIKTDQNEIPLVMGASEDATDGYDYLDAPALPTIVSDVKAGFYHPEWHKKSNLYTADIVNYREDREFKWNLRIYFGKNKYNRLLISETNSNVKFLLLRDTAKNSLVSLRDGSFYDIVPEKGEICRDIELIWRSAELNDFLNKNDKLNFTCKRLGKRYMFTYTLPDGIVKMYPVVLEIYKIDGKKIGTLVREVQTAGHYNVNWTIEDSRIRSGIYIVKFKTNSYSKRERIYIF